MRAVMYGAGNIGRGFVGALMSGAGYEVTFIDVDQTLVSRLREKGEYPLRVIDNEGYIDTLIKNVSAVDGTDAAATGTGRAAEGKSRIPANCTAPSPASGGPNAPPIPAARPSSTIPAPAPPITCIVALLSVGSIVIAPQYTLRPSGPASPNREGPV